MSGAGLSQEQFVVLIARLERRVRSFIATLVGGNRDAIDEIIQSSYLVAWRKLSSFTYLDSTPDEELVRWICTIARFETKNYMRSRRHRHFVFDEDLIDRIADIQIDEQEYLEARHEALAECLGRLEARQRQLLSMRYGRNLSVKELAAQQGRQVGAVYTTLCRIRRLLQHCIESHLRREGYC